MGRKERIEKMVGGGLADLIAIGRPLIGDPRLIEKWKQGKTSKRSFVAAVFKGASIG